MRVPRGLVVLGVVLGCSGWAGATNRYFSDIVAKSPGGRYEVQARSPDNKPGSRRRPFQASFVYTCTDMKTRQAMWTRRQPMEEPRPMGTSGAMYDASPKEAAPVDIYVSDAGWTVIVTAWYELIAIDPKGGDRCHIALLEQAMSEQEREAFVHPTTAGPMWTGCSLWYFLDAAGQRLFVVRPWWGRRILVDLHEGQLANESEAIAKAIVDSERDHVMAQLGKAARTRKTWGEADDDAFWPTVTAAYLAGPLKIREAVPLLRQLEEVAFIDSSTSGAFGDNGLAEGQVERHDYSTQTLRQAVQLSLRRLGETPRPLSPIVFQTYHKEYEKRQNYSPKPLAVPRHTNTDKVRKGMTPEQVLALLGGPDYIRADGWEYDMDSSPPATVIIQWDGRKMAGVEKKTPPLWKEGFLRDEEIAYP